MIRLRLSPGDLARIAVRPGLGAFGEALLSFDMVRQGTQFGDFHPWTKQMRASASDLVKRTAALFTMHGPPLDLFTNVAESADFDTAIDGFLSIPDGVYRDEMTFVLSARRLPASTRPLTGTDLTSRRLLAEAISDAAKASVLPHRARIDSFLATECATTAQTLAHGGADRMLRGLHPAIRWAAPWLTVGCDDAGERRYVSEGQGVTFIPSVLLSGRPIVFRSADRSRPWFVLYPAVKDLTDLVRLHKDPKSRGATAKLMGQSRADLLEAIAERPGLPVKELASLVGVSIGAASEHIAVLRNAGLVAGRRQGKAHIHVLTRLGASLLLAAHEPVRRSMTHNV